MCSCSKLKFPICKTGSRAPASQKLEGFCVSGLIKTQMIFGLAMATMVRTYQATLCPFNFPGISPASDSPLNVDDFRCECLLDSVVVQPCGAERKCAV